VLLVDDLLATGGTAEAGIRLIERLGGEVVGCAFVIDLPDLGGRRRLEALGMAVHALCAFEGTASSSPSMGRQDSRPGWNRTMPALGGGSMRICSPSPNRVMSQVRS
jgi:hypothetical protein